jgi:3-oxoacyl-[acyl-carrier protein] reductase
MMGKLSGKVALVTGGARGLGREYALRLASLGADVGIIDIDLHSYNAFEGEKALLTADTTMDEIRALGRRSFGVEADISKRDQVYSAVEKIAKELGDISICVCNAGGGSGGFTENTPTTLDFDQWDMVMGRNLNGMVYTINAVAPMMKKNKFGKIVTVSSHAGIETTHNGGYAHYSTAKAAIRFFTLMTSAELGPYGITVNCIAPGWIATGRLIEQFKKAGVEYYNNCTSLRRLGTPEDCAKVVEFFTTDLSDFVTGVTVQITGGTTNKQ